MSIASFGPADFRHFVQPSFLLNKAVVDHAKQKIQLLDDLERSPDCKMDSRQLDEQFTMDYVNLYCRSDQRWRIQKIVDRILIFLGFQPSDKEVDRALEDYTLRRTAFRYRTGLLHKTSKVNPELIKELQTAVLAFKRNHLYSAEQRKMLSGHDQKQIRKMAQYPDLVRQMLKSPKRIETLFKFTIRNLYSVSCLVRFPATSEKLYDISLAQQLNAWHAKKHIRRIKETNSVGTMFAYEGRFVDILREKEVNVAENLKVPVADVFADFKSQANKHGEYSLLVSGIKKWAINRSWKPPEGTDTSNIECLDDLRKLVPGINDTVDTVSFDELKCLFPKLEYGESVYSFVGSRQSADRNIINSHGYMRIRRPCGNNKYEIISLGVYADSWPPADLSFLLFIGDTKKADWCFPDPNAKYSQRMMGEIVRVFKPDDPEIKRIEKDLVKSLLDPELIFQFSDKNCAENAERVVFGCKETSLIRVPIDKVITPLPFKLWTIPYSLTPEFLLPVTMKVIVITIGGFRSMYGQNLFNTQVERTGKFNYPGRVIELVESGEQPGIVFGGHNRDYEAVTA